MTGTLGREVISTRQRKIAELAQREPKLTLTTLAHHVDDVWMRDAYRRIRKDAAAGVDGVTAAQYEAELEANLSGLLERFKSGGYRAPAVRRVHLEKPGTNKTRPIGIPTLEDKILQRAVLMVMEPATAHELARMVYLMLSRGQSFVERGIECFEEERRIRQVKHLHRKARELGFSLTEATAQVA